MAISRIGWYAIWLISLLSYAGAHRVSPLGVSPFAWMQSTADTEAKPIFPNLGLKSGAWKFEKKKFPCHSGRNMKASCLVMTGPKTMKKH